MNAPGRFVGRRRELATLLSAVDGGAPVVLVVGDAGIGKSRLSGPGCT
jgi:predicted ATPase